MSPESLVILMLDSSVGNAVVDIAVADVVAAAVDS